MFAANKVHNVFALKIYAEKNNKTKINQYKSPEYSPYVIVYKNTSPRQKMSLNQPRHIFTNP